MNAHGHCRHRPDLCSTRFTRTPDDVLDDPQLSPAERLLLIWLARYEFRLHGRYPGTQALADDMHLSRSQVHRLLAHLEELGWLERTGGGPGCTCSITWPSPARRLPLDVAPTRHQGRAHATSDVALVRHQPSRPCDTPKETRDAARAGFLQAGRTEAEWNDFLHRLNAHETP